LESGFVVFAALLSPKTSAARLLTSAALTWALSSARCVCGDRRIESDRMVLSTDRSLPAVGRAPLEALVCVGIGPTTGAGGGAQAARTAAVDSTKSFFTNLLHTLTHRVARIVSGTKMPPSLLRAADCPAMLRH